MYQPQQGLPAGDWSGTQLTASSSYTNPANPMAAATDGDQSLQSIIEAYPPRWDGFLQLRMYLSTAGHEPYEATYPTLNVQVTGDTWQAVGGSPVNCASGTAVSIESVLLPPSTTTSTTAAAPASSPAATPTTTASGQGKGAAVGATPASDAKSSPGRGTPAGSAQASGTGRSVAATQTSDLPVVLGIVLAVLVVLGAAFSLVLRRRRLASTPLPSGSPLVSPSAPFNKQLFNERRHTMKNPVRRTTLRAVTTALLGATLVISTVLVSAVFASSAGASTTPPWEPITNPPEAGGLTFYNSSGQVITGGNISDPVIAAYIQGNTILQGQTAATVADLNGFDPDHERRAGHGAGQLERSAPWAARICRARHRGPSAPRRCRCTRTRATACLS